MKKARIWQRPCAALLAFLLLFSVPIPAQAGLQEIRVTASGQDPSPTRAAAMALDYAKKRAVYLVMLKMKIPNPIVRAQSLTEAQMAQIVRGATVNDTRRVEQITYADVSVSVVDTAILRVLEIDTPPDSVALEAAPPEKGVLVLPVYITKTQVFVWEKDNILRGPLSSQALKLSHGTVVVPTGDYEDLRLIDQHNALTVKAEDLEPMFERYGAREIIIATVSQDQQMSEDGTSVLLRRLSPAFSHTEELKLRPPTETESVNDRINEITSEIAAAATQIAISTSKQDQDKIAAASQIPIYFYYGSMREIGQIQDTLRGTDGVIQFSMPTIALNNIHGILYYSGDKELLKKALTKKGLIITPRADGWQVSLR